MTIPLLIADNCTVVEIIERVHHDGIHWREHVRAEIRGGPKCKSITIGLPMDAQLKDLHGRIERFQLPDTPIESERVRTFPRQDGTTAVVIQLDAYNPRDIVSLRFERRHGLAAPFVWQPGLSQPKYAELRLPLKPFTSVSGIQIKNRRAWAANPAPSDILRLRHPWSDNDPPAVSPVTKNTTLSPQDARTRLDNIAYVGRAFSGASVLTGQDVLRFGAADDRGFARTIVALTAQGPQAAKLAHILPIDPTAGPQGGFEVAVVQDAQGAWHAVVPKALSLPAGTLLVDDAKSNFGAIKAPPSRTAPWQSEVSLQLDVHGRRLQPATEHGQWAEHATIRWNAPHIGPKVAKITLTPDTQVVSAQCDRVRQTPYAIWLMALPTTPFCQVHLTHRLDAPWDRRTPALAGTSVKDAGVRWHQPDGTVIHGKLVTNSTSWRLASIGDTHFLATASDLAHRLDTRWRVASIPEPGHPMHGLDRRLSWDQIPKVLALLRAEVVLNDDLAVVPDVPRPMLQARRGISISRTELAMLLTLYLRQHKLDADWFLVAPHQRDVPSDGNPSDFTEAVVRVRKAGHEAWIAPSCIVCLPFELPPELAGSQAIGPAGVAQLPSSDPGEHPTIGRDGRVYRADGSMAQGAFASRLQLGSEGALWTLGGAFAIYARRGAAPWPSQATAIHLNTPEGAVKVSLPEATPLRLGIPSPAAPGVYERVRPTPDWQDDLRTCKSEAPQWQLTIQTENGMTAERLVIRTHDLPADALNKVDDCLQSYEQDHEHHQLHDDAEHNAEP